MGLFDSLRNLFGGKSTNEVSKEEHQAPLEEEVVGIPMTDEEKRIVAIISSVIAANDRPDSEFKVKSITRTK